MSSRSVPSYCHHKASGQAYVKLDGKRVYLGKHGTPESRARYNRTLSEWLSQQDTLPASLADISVGKLAILHLEHARRRYRKDGQQTSEVHIIQAALRFITKRYRDLPASQFSPRALKAVREDMIEAGLARTTINALIIRIRRMYRWAVSEEIVDERLRVLEKLKSVPDLRADGGEARETEPVKPVSDACVDAIRPHVRPAVWAMIELQRCTGMRPGEVLLVRGCDLNTSGGIWEYRPERHKNQHRRKDRCVFIGPKGQAILREWLRPELDAYLFSPQADGQKPYRRDSYTNAIRRGCEVAFGMTGELRDIARTLAKLNDITEAERLRERDRLSQLAAKWREENCWSPHQLRHSFATTARRSGGIEAARVTLGHSSASVSEIYAERDFDAARAVVARIG